jgi:hypothetical protein
MILVSIDPGLDVTGLAVFDIPPRPPRADGLFAPSWVSASETSKAACCGDVRCVRTKPETPMPARLARLAGELRDLLETVGANLVLVEVPAVAGGAYHGKRGRGGHGVNVASMGAYFSALGVILAAAHETTGRVIECAASGAKKPVKRAIAVGALKAARVPLKLTNQDAADAVFVGLAAPWDFADPPPATLSTTTRTA